MRSCAVIGCGPAGMVASTVLRQSGLMVTCFDVAPEPGGIWASNARDVFSSRGCISPVYPSMRCFLPKELMAFSDVRFDYAVAQFPHHTAVQHYMQQYATRKGVRGLTRFNSKVESVRFDMKDRQWKLLSVNVVNGDVMEWSFDRICVCTGHTQEVHFPPNLRETLQGYVREGGEVHHSAHVKDFRAFHKKRVVVVGDGVSAYDYCVELKRMGAEVFHSTAMQAAASPVTSEVGAPSSPPSLTRALWEGAAAMPVGATHAANGPSDLRVAADMATSLADLAALLPWMRRDEGGYTTAHLLRRWLRYRNRRLEGVQTVGLPLDNDGRGLRFASDPLRKESAREKVEVARLRAFAGTKGSPVAGMFIDNIDAVICATGYNRRYPFLHQDVRRVLEREDQQLLTSSLPSFPVSPCPTHALGEEVNVESSVNRRGLYLGTLWSAQPSLALVGYQKELLPPFLLYEAQARFVAYVFTERTALPVGEAGMSARETELIRANPGLADLYNDSDGVGLRSAVYFNVLQHELGVSSRDTYAAKLRQRQWWLLSSMLVRLYHKARSMAPLKRKQQHILFSNKI